MSRLVTSSGELTRPGIKWSLFLAWGLLFCAAPTWAATVCWTNLNGGNWNVAANWAVNGNGANQTPGSGDTVLIVSNGTYTVTNNVSTTNAGFVLGGTSGTQTLTNSAGLTLTLNGSGTSNPNGVLGLFNLTLAGTGSLVANGPLILNGVSITLDGGVTANDTLTMSGGPTLGPSSSFTNVVLLINNGTATLSSSLYFYPISAFLNSATLTLNPSGSISVVDESAGGGQFINSGQLVNNVPSGDTVTIGPVFENSYGTVTLNSGTLYFESSYVQTAGLTLLDGGNINNTSALQIDGGTLAGNGAVIGSVTSSGTVSPGAPLGQLTIGGSYVQTANGTLDIVLGGTGAGTNFDVLVVTNDALLGGALNVTFTNGFSPAPNASFTFVNAGTLSDNFASFSYPSNFVGMQIVYATNSVSVQVLSNGVAPDLAPVGFAPATNHVVSYPASPQSPTVQVSWAVTNEGTGAASGYWYDAVYVSTNTTTAGAISSSIYTAPASLPVGGQYSTNVTITLPQQSGSYYLVLSVNDGHTLLEDNFTNNLATVPISVTYQVQPPDLAPVSFVPATNNVVFYPPSPQPPTVQVSWAVTNEGTGVAAGDWYDTVYVSTNGTLSGQVSSTIVSYEEGPVPVGGRYGGTNTVSLPQQSGTYYLILGVNDGHTLFESNYANNVATPVPITVIYQVQPPPDLAPVSFAEATNHVVFYPASPQSPTVQVSWAVTNQGTGVAAGDWYDAVYVSTNGTLSGQVSSTIVSDETGPVPVGGQYRGANTVVLPQQSGTYYLILSVNDGQTLYESNYANNVASPVPITVTYQVIPPDLAPVSFAEATNHVVFYPASPLSPQVQVSWAVTNQGIGVALGYWYDRVYVSTNGTLNGQVTSTIVSYETRQVPVGGEYSGTNTVVLPQQSGTYYLILSVNDGQTLYESNYVNNVAAPVPITVTYQVVPPDLQVVAVSAPQQAWTGRGFDASWILTNAGPGVAVGPWDDRVYLSVTNQLETNVDQVLGDFSFPGPLAPGQSIQLTEPVTINRAGITNGFYYLSVLANASNSLYEATTTNNVGVSSSNLYVQLTPLPALAVSSVDAPSNGIGGQVVGVSWVECNNGQGDTEEPVWYDHLYLSRTTNLTAIVQDYGVFENPSFLAVGDCYEQDVTVTLPLDISGLWYFIVNADSTGQVNEDDITNNLGSTATPINIQLVTPGFLHVASVQVSPAPPTTVWAGDTVTVTWTVENIGQSPLCYYNPYGSPEPGWDDEVTLSPTPEYDFVHGYWDVVNHQFFTGPFPLGPGQSYIQTNSFSVPYGITPGNWYVVPIVNTHYIATDCSIIGTNNIGRDQTNALLLVSPPIPADLEVTSVSTPRTAYAGQSLSVSWVVSNNGLNATPAVSSAWFDGVYLSTDGTFNTNQNLLLGAGLHSGVLALGASYTNSAVLTLPSSVLPAGAASVTNYLFVYTDLRDNVFELTKTNNVLEAPSPLLVLPPGLPNLAVTSVSAPAAVLAGTDAGVTWTVTNQGTEGTGTNGWTDSIYLSADGTFNPAVDTLLGSAPNVGALFPGDSYTNTINLKIPYCPLGSYVVVVADSGHQIPQSGSGTNALASRNPMRILPNDGARLGVSAVSSAASVHAGQPLAVSWSVTNSGNATASEPWIDGIYLSPKGVDLSGSAYLLGRYTNQSYLGPGASYSQSKSYFVPQCLSGTYYVTAITDISNVVNYLSCDTNNFSTALAPVQVAPVAYPSLQVASLTVPAALTSAVPWAIQWSVTNAGPGGASGTWFDAVYASVSPVLDANAVFLGQFEHSGGLASGAAYSQSQSVQIPPCTSSNSYVFVMADVSNAVNVAAVCQVNNPARTTNALPVNFGVYPNLRVSAFSVPATVNAGQPMMVSWTVINAGLGVAEGTWVDSLSLDGTALGSYPQAGPLAPGATYTQSASVTLTNVSGSVYLTVITDATNAVQECLSFRNNLTVGGPVRIQPTLYPDLKVTAVQVPATAFAGQPITVSWAVMNQGTGSAGPPAWNDAVYLARGEVLDNNAVRLGNFQNVTNLGVGRSYTNSATVVIPPGNAGPFYILVLADSAGVLFERLGYNDSLGFNPDAILVSLGVPAQLTPGNVTLTPATGVPGTAAAIGWKVSNVSSNNTVNTWTDAVYLSTNNFWDLSAMLVTNVNHTALAAQASYNGSWSGSLPALSPGSYYAIVRADVRDTVPEISLTNLTAVSPNTISMDVPIITLGQTVTNALTTGGAQYYKVNCPAGQTVKVTLTGVSTNSFNELYVRFGAVPDLVDYDFSYNNPLAPNQQITIPATQAGWYYIMVVGGNEPAGPLGYSLVASIVPFAISSVTPNFIGDNGQVTITVNGALFQSGASVQLVSGTNSYFPETNFFINGTSVRARFLFTNAIHETYDVVLTNPGNQSTTATQAVTIQTALPLTSQVMPIGPVNSEPRVGLPFKWVGAVVNAGNVDISYLTVWVSLDQSFPIALAPPLESVLYHSDSTDNSGNLCFFMARDLPPGGSLDFSFVVSGFGPNSFFYYIIPTNQSKQDFLVQMANEAEGLREYALSTPDALDYTTTNTSGIVTTNVGALPTNVLAALSDTNLWEIFFAQALVSQGILDPADLTLVPPPPSETQLAGLIHPQQRPLLSCTAGCNLTVVGCHLVCAVGALLCIASTAGLLSALCLVGELACLAVCLGNYNTCLIKCRPPPPPICAPASSVRALYSRSIHSNDDGPGGGGGGVCPEPPKDPNEKQGPPAYSAAAFVGSQVPWQYTIFCQNATNAAAFARQVTINDTLDPHLDIRTFRVGEIKIGTNVITVPTNRAFYQVQVPLPPPNPSNVVAQITASVNVQSNSIFWTMNAIDLNTGQLVVNTDEGILPPDDTNGVGEAYVTYTIKPLAGVPTGTVITNQASIVFDINDPIPTDITTNTVDAVPPTSYVEALPPLTTSNTFPVFWAGTDDPGGSGVANYSIFFSDNDGPYQIWLANTTTNSAQFPGQYGHTYAFYSMAQDNAGNVEASHATPDTTTTVSSPPVVAPVGDQTVAAGGEVVVTNSASDANVPAPTFTYSLGPGAPAGASVGTNGVFHWTPTCAQGSTTNLITIWVTASGSPPLSNSISFFVTVAECVEVGIGSTVVQAGQSASVPVNLLTTVALTNLSFTLSYPANRFTNWMFSFTNVAVATGTVQTLDPSDTLFSLATKAGQALQGPTVAASLSFRALPGSSAFIPLTVSNVAGTSADGSAVGNISGLSGSVVVVGREPLLEAWLSTNRQRMLTLYGNPGASYEVDYVTNLHLAQWQLAWRTPMTNLSEIFTANALLPQVFYRGFEFTATPPLLQEETTPSGALESLLLYGAPGSAYALQYTTNVLAGWRTLYLLPLTNSFAFLNTLSSLGGDVYYRIEVVQADPPILDLNSSAASNLVLLLYGQKGSNYTVLSGTNLTNGTHWAPVVGFTLTNSFQFINAGEATNRSQFYKAKRQ